MGGSQFTMDLDAPAPGRSKFNLQLDKDLKQSRDSLNVSVTTNNPLEEEIAEEVIKEEVRLLEDVHPMYHGGQVTSANPKGTTLGHFDFQKTVAFWSAIFFIEGSVLFTIGSICMYPDVELHTWKYKGWVDYTFMIGAWCFTVGNYLNYFLVINAEYNYDDLLAAGFTMEQIEAADKDKDGNISM